LKVIKAIIIIVSSQLGQAISWVDRLRTSANERVLSGRRAVVIA